jgi:peptidoglycan-associated lipoprotein
VKIQVSCLVALAVIGMLTAGCASRSRTSEPATSPAPLPAADPAPRATEATAADPEIVAPSLDPVYFAYDSHALDATAKATLDQIARSLRDRPDRTITIEGHCDERGTVEYNLALGERRAMAVREYLTAAGVQQARLRIVSYGKERPFVQGSGESTWAQNRRAHFVGP